MWLFGTDNKKRMGISEDQILNMDQFMHGIMSNSRRQFDTFALFSAIDVYNQYKQEHTCILFSISVDRYTYGFRDSIF